MSEQVFHDQLESDLQFALESEDGLNPLIITFAHSVADHWDIANHYHGKVREACDLWIEGDNEAHGIKQLTSALFYYYVTQFDKVDEPDSEAIRIFEETGSGDLLGVGCMIKGTCLRSLGRFDEGVQFLTRACAKIDSAGAFRSENDTKTDN